MMNNQMNKSQEKDGKPVLPFFEAVFFTLIKEIGFRGTKIDNFRATIAIFFQNGTFFTIISIANAGTTTDNTTSLIRAIIAFIANTNQCRRSYV